MTGRFATLTGAVLVTFSAAQGAAGADPLKLIHTIPLPGVKGRFDHFACDPADKRLVVAALGNNTGELFDVAEFKHLHTFTGLHKPTGALALVEPHRFCFANGDDGTFRAFDAATKELAAALGGVDDADNIRYDAATRLIYIGYGEGALGVTDPVTNKLLHNIKLAAHPESFQLETHGPRIFVNIPGERQIAVVDREQRKVIATWPIQKWQANFPMALDEKDHRLFIGCRKPATLVIFDMERGVPVADVAISGDTDDLFYDAKRRQLYVSSGEGFVDVITQRDPDHYERTARIATRAGARTSYFSPDLDLYFLAVPEVSGQPAELRVYRPE